MKNRTSPQVWPSESEYSSNPTGERPAKIEIREGAHCCCRRVGTVKTHPLRRETVEVRRDVETLDVLTTVTPDMRHAVIVGENQRMFGLLHRRGDHDAARENNYSKEHVGMISNNLRLLQPTTTNNQEHDICYTISPTWI